MIKFIVAALWLCAVTVGTIFFSFSQAGQKTAAAETAAPFFGGLDYVKADLISVPLIRNARVDGYVLAQLVYTAEPREMRKLSIPIQNLLTDEAYAFIYADPAFDMAKFDLEGFKTGLRDSINKRVGSQLIHDVLIEQIDYLPKTDIRNKNPQRFPMPTRNSESPAAAASGH